MVGMKIPSNYEFKEGQLLTQEKTKIHKRMYILGYNMVQLRIILYNHNNRNNNI